MIAEILHDNLVPWFAQVVVIATLGAVLPMLFRIRHPRTHLAYSHLVLAACAVLPLIQPWQHATVTSHTGLLFASARSGTAAVSAAGRIFAVGETIALWVLAAGFVLRLGWLGIGMLQIRRFRIAATPLDSIPEAVSLASRRTGAMAIFRISSTVTSPATMGLFRPVVLLPKSFLQLSAASQHGIACHELLHVRRRDWMVTVIEEVVASVFWFHPGVWWLLAQTRLSREQLVDAEVVRLTSARDPYIAALLAIAGTRLELDLAPAPLFLRRRHLTQRMHSLLTEVSMSKLRLVTSYAAMAAILAMAGWVMFLSFPLQVHATPSALPASSAAVAAATVQDPPPPPPPPSGVVGGGRNGGGGGTQDAPPPPPPPPPPPGQDGEKAPIRLGGDSASGNLIYKVNPVYPLEARQARIQGVVILNVTIAKDGHVADAKVISSTDPLLVPGSVEAVRQWVYKPVMLNGEPVEVITTVTINYSLGK